MVASGRGWAASHARNGSGGSTSLPGSPEPNGTAPAKPGFSAPFVEPGAGSDTAPAGPGFSGPFVGPGAGSGTAPVGPGFSGPFVGPGAGSGTAPAGPGFCAPSWPGRG